MNVYQGIYSLHPLEEMGDAGEVYEFVCSIYLNVKLGGFCIYLFIIIIKSAENEATHS